ncbi:MAG: HU family DNA-binding protein [Desulfuromonadales bacterium]|nr:HU family DNA-binding protein [Desulfuromonadales bacterium]
MNKTDLIEAIATQSGLSKAAANEALTATFACCLTGKKHERI